MTTKTHPDLKSLKKKLLKERVELEHLSESTEDDRQVVELDQSMVGRLSRMDALQNQAMQVETERRRTVELRRIDAALKRIEEDEYGYCVSCGEEIETKRIKNDPTIPTCISCASAASK